MEQLFQLNPLLEALETSGQHCYFIIAISGHYQCVYCLQATFNIYNDKGCVFACTIINDDFTIGNDQKQLSY